MNNLYCKVAVASICTALSFTLVTNKEAKAATFNLTATKFFIQGQTNLLGGSRDRVFDNENSNEVSIIINGSEATRPEDFYSYERRGFYEFNIGNLSLVTNTVISRAILDIPIRNVSANNDALFLNLLGYVGNGKPDLSDFEAGVYLGRQNPFYIFDPFGGFLHNINFDVTNFVNQRVSNRDGFAGFGIRAETVNVPARTYGRFTLDYDGYEPTLKIETVDVPEPVPEPTTIFSSALALGVGGWLKRKKSSQQNKTTPQH
jgi:hypothetical protein